MSERLDITVLEALEAVLFKWVWNASESVRQSFSMSNFGILNVRFYPTTVDAPASHNQCKYVQTLLCFIEPAYIEVSLLSNSLFGPYRTMGYLIY